MANTIRHKRNSTATAIPAAANLVTGELAINTADGKLFTKKENGTVVEIGGAAGAEPALGNPSVNGYVLSSTTAGVRSWIAQTGGGGSVTIKSATLALGATPKATFDINVTDAAIAASSNIIITLVNDTDEVEMQPMTITAKPFAGGFTAQCVGLEGRIYGTFKISYLA